MGPGQTPQTCGKFEASIRSVYSVLAPRLARDGLAVCHLHWRQPPTRKGAPPGTLKAPATLHEGACDIADAVGFLRGVYGAELPLVLVGFSFGGPSSMAAACLALTSDRPAFRAFGPLAGVVTLGTGLRVGMEGSNELADIGRALKGGASRAMPHE